MIRNPVVYGQEAMVGEIYVEVPPAYDYYATIALPNTVLTVDTSRSDFTWDARHGYVEVRDGDMGSLYFEEIALSDLLSGENSFDGTNGIVVEPSEPILKHQIQYDKAGKLSIIFEFA